jgi:hypothetical protein
LGDRGEVGMMFYLALVFVLIELVYSLGKAINYMLDNDVNPIAAALTFVFVFPLKFIPGIAAYYVWSSLQ